jgi:hypothetical protein
MWHNASTTYESILGQDGCAVRARVYGFLRAFVYFLGTLVSAYRAIHERLASIDDGLAELGWICPFSSISVDRPHDASQWSVSRARSKMDARGFGGDASAEFGFVDRRFGVDLLAHA